MLAYKVAENAGKRVIVTLQIPDDALTNMNRSSIVNKETAWYRTNKAVVVKIESKKGKLYDTAKSNQCKCEGLVYSLGKLVEEPSFNTDIEKVCAEGIHFFLNKRQAELYGLEEIKNGLFQEWDTSGQKTFEVMYIDGKPEGLSQSWYSSGQKMSKINMKNGLMDGVAKGWYENGQMSRKTTYENGKEEGLFKRWHENGNKLCKVNMKNGKEEGLYEEWHRSGPKCIEVSYVNGKRDGIYQKWYDNGIKACEIMYKDGEVIYSKYYNYITGKQQSASL